MSGTYDKPSYNCVRNGYHCPSTVCQIQDEPTTFYMLRANSGTETGDSFDFDGDDVRPPVELITGDWKTIGLAVDVLEIFKCNDFASEQGAIDCFRG